MVDREYDVRCNNRIKRLIHKAQFPNTHAFLEDIEYLPDRHLNKDLLQRLATNEYINKKRNVIFIGATGCGKTFLAKCSRHKCLPGWLQDLVYPIARPVR
ncbi:MAG: ATP-binding protein [Smithella sp.]